MTKVLIVDDEKHVRLTTRAFLRSDETEVFTAGSGMEAQRLFEEHNFDVALLDIIMPRMTGVELLKWIKEHSPGTQVVMITGEPHVDTAAEVIRVGAFDYLTKPVVKAELQKVVNRAVTMKGLLDERRKLRKENRRYQADLEDLVEERTRKLVESEKRFRTLYESMSEGVALHELVYDGEGKAVDYRIIDVNPMYETITGLKPGDAIGAYASELYGAGEAPYLNIYKEVARTGVPTSFDTYFEPLEKYFHISVSSPVKGVFATVFFDQSEKKSAEEALRESQERFNYFMENIPAGVFIKDDESRALYLNRYMMDTFDAKGWLGKTVFEAFPEDIARAMVEDDRKALTRGHQRITETFSMKDGTSRTFETHKFPILRKGKSPLLGGFAFDVTEKVAVEKGIRVAEQAALASKEQLKSFIDTSSIGIWYFRPLDPIETSLPVEEQIDGFFKAVCVDCNESYAKMMGISRKEIIGISLSDVMEDTLDNRAYFRKFIGDGYRIVDGVSRETIASGEERYFSNSFIATVRDGRLTEAWGTQSDITKLKKHEEEILNVITNTGHLINTPFTVALGYLDMVKDGIKEMTPELLDKILENLKEVRTLLSGEMMKNVRKLTVKTSDGLTPVGREKM